MFHGHAAQASPACGILPLVTYSPSQIRHAYGLDTIVGGDGAGQTIAIVDAYDDPSIARDLATFDAKFGIAAPPSFIKAMQGAVRPSVGWAEEISLDVEWAHAIAPKAGLLLVESRSSSLNDLVAAVDYAVGQGAKIVSMSWGSGEFSTERSYDYHFNRPGVTFLNSSGDSGAPAGWPVFRPVWSPLEGPRCTWILPAIALARPDGAVAEAASAYMNPSPRTRPAK